MPSQPRSAQLPRSTGRTSSTSLLARGAGLGQQGTASPACMACMADAGLKPWHRQLQGCGRFQRQRWNSMNLVVPWREEWRQISQAWVGGGGDWFVYVDLQHPFNAEVPGASLAVPSRLRGFEKQ